MLFLVTFFVFLGVAAANVVSPGQCDQTIKPMKKFDAQKFCGVWYEISWMEESPAVVGDCVKATFTYKNDGIDFVFDLVSNGEPASFSGSATLDKDADGYGKLTATDPNPILSPTRMYWVLSTDYDNYYLGYGCKNVGDDKKSISSWIYSRSPCLDPKSVLKINDIIKDIDGITWDTYEYTNNTEAACKGNKK